MPKTLAFAAFARFLSYVYFYENIYVSLNILAQDEGNYILVFLYILTNRKTKNKK